MKQLLNRACMLFFIGLFVSNVSAQYATNFSIVEVNDEDLEMAVNLTVSDFLTTLNVAQHDNISPEELKEELLMRCNISEDAINTMGKLWIDCPFTCLDNEICERMVEQPTGEFQIRNIHLVMKPVEGVSKDISWKKYQEGVITLDKTGRIINFHLALDPSLYISVMGSAKEVDDLEYRMLILEYVERFRNAYNLKDMDFLQKIYSEDALIITGKVVKQVKRDAGMMDENDVRVEYTRQKKAEYLSRLASVFRNNKRINVTFDKIEVVRHPANVNFYGVTLVQGWESDSYSDVGYLFLLWDFTNPDAPQIHVRTWQPTEYNHKPVELKDEIFSVDDFDI